MGNKPLSPTEPFEISNIEWKLTIDSLEDIVLLLDNEGNILRGNRVIEKWDLGSITKINGLPFTRLFHPHCSDDNCYLRRCWHRANENLSQKKPYSFEIKDTTLNRHLRFKFLPTAMEHKSLNSRQKSIAYAVLVIIDISKQEYVSERIHQFSVERNAIFYALNDQCIRIDSVGNILSCDGYSGIDKLNAESVGMNIESVMPKSFKAKCIKALKEIMKTKNPTTIESAVTTCEGNQIFEFIFLPILKDQVNIIIKNITEKKRLESIAQQLELMNNLGMVFSSLRHEIGNPMNSIKMTATVLRENINEYSRQKIDEYMQRIVEELNRVEFLLQNLKSFTMWEDCQLRSIIVQDFMEEFHKLIQTDLNKKGIKVIISMDQNLPKIHTDPRALHQVLLNVVNNAMDALYKRKNPLLHIKISSNHGRVNMLLEDNGAGIPESEKKNLFNPFFTTKKDGTGLGLLITRKILSRLSGTIEIKSDAGKGTKIYITLPEKKIE